MATEACDTDVEAYRRTQGPLRVVHRGQEGCAPRPAPPPAPRTTHGEKEMIVEELIATRPAEMIKVQPDHSVHEAARLFSDRRTGVIMVCGNDGSMKGVVSLGDVVYAISEQGPTALDRPVEEIMTADVVSCEPEDDIESAIQKMNDLGVRHLPVVADGLVIDVITHTRALEVLYRGAALDFAQLRSYVFKSGGRY